MTQNLAEHVRKFMHGRAVWLEGPSLVPTQAEYTGYLEINHDYQVELDETVTEYKGHLMMPVTFTATAKIDPDGRATKIGVTGGDLGSTRHYASLKAVAAGKRWARENLLDTVAAYLEAWVASLRDEDELRAMPRYYPETRMYLDGKLVTDSRDLPLRGARRRGLVKGKSRCACR